MSTATPPRSYRRFLTPALAVLALAGVASTAYLAWERQASRTETQSVEYVHYENLTKMVIREVTTLDGQRVRFREEVPETVPVVKMGTREVTYAISPAERQRLNIVLGCAIIGGGFLVFVIILWGRAQWYHKKPSKEVSDWLNRLLCGVVGAALGFAGSPPPEPQPKEPPPATAPAEAPKK